MLRPASCALVCCVVATVLVTCSAYPSSNNYVRDVDGYESPDEMSELMNRIGNLIRLEHKMDNYYGKDDISSSKRALDLGLSRGYSGLLQAKHLMGLAAANYPTGPGRKRRDTQH